METNNCKQRGIENSVEIVISESKVALLTIDDIKRVTLHNLSYKSINNKQILVYIFTIYRAVMQK